MPTQLVPGEDDVAAVMACVGHVCIQWSLLEQTLIIILGTCQSIPPDEAAIVFGGLDMKPRLNLAINLAEHHKWPPPLVKRLRKLRADIDKEKLVDKRNIIVHGVQCASELPQSFKLYTPRRKGDAQEETWSILEAHALGEAIHTAHKEAYAIFEEYGRLKLGDHRPIHTSGEVVAAQPRSIVARLKQYLRTRLDNLGR